MRPTARVCLMTLLFSAPAARAQSPDSPIQKGSIAIGGTADISHTEPDGSGSALTIIQAFPRLGYFVVKGLALSANGRYRRVSAEDQAAVRDQTSTEWGIGPGVSYYVATRLPRLFPFVSTRVLYNRTSNHAEILPAGPEVDSRITTVVWLGSAGALFILGKHVGLTSEVFYQRNNNTIRNGTAESTSDSNTYGIQWGISAFIF